MVPFASARSDEEILSHNITETMLIENLVRHQLHVYNVLFSSSYNNDELTVVFISSCDSFVDSL